MKRFAMVLVLSLIGISGFCQDKIGVVDIERVIAQSAHGKKLQTEMNAFFEKTRNEIMAVEKEAQSLVEQLQAPGLSEDAATNLNRKLEDKKLDLKRLREDKTQEAQAMENKSLGQIEKALVPVMERITKENGYTMLLNLRMEELTWADPALDITSMVIAEFDKAQ